MYVVNAAKAKNADKEGNCHLYFCYSVTCTVRYTWVFTTAILRITRGRVVLIELSSPVAFHKSVCVHQERNAAGINVSHIMHTHTPGVRFARGVKIWSTTLDGFLITVWLFRGSAAMCGLFCPNHLISNVHLIATVPAFKTMASNLYIYLICTLSM